MDYEPSGPVITSIFELKLDPNTMFEWQKYSQSSTAVPHYQDLLEFINFRTQASDGNILKYWTSRYDRPRLIHRMHVKMILEAPRVPERSCVDCTILYNSIFCALKGIDYEPSGPFITSIFELKLDPNTMFEWQKYSQSSTAVPHYQDLLEFINLRTQASKIPVADSAKKQTKHESPSARKPFASSKTVALFAASTDSATNLCLACKTEKHPLYACTKCPHDKKVSTLKTNNLCMNCLGSGHFVRQCKSLHRCEKCQ